MWRERGRTMPRAEINGIQLYYEVHGEGPNLALIEGLGYDCWMWYRQAPAFAGHFRVLMYDNRGVGRSDAPPGPYSHEGNASDLAALLDHVGWDCTHVLGISMGGFIAQQFALNHPERLDRLVLAATGFGGPHMAPVPPAAVAAMTLDPSLPAEERIRRAMPIAFSAPSWTETHREEFDYIVRRRLEYPQPPHGAMAQLMAGVTFNVEARLGEISAPTLVLVGSEDQVVPPRNAELLAAALPNARRGILAGCGHVLNIECPEEFNGAVIHFLLAEDSAQ